MNGEILNIKEDGSGVILAEDGNRYSFTQEDTNSQTLRVGQKVNFVLNEGFAKDIFIIKSQNNSFTNNEIIGSLQIDKSDTRKGAVFAAIGVGISFLGILPAIGVLFLIIGLVLELVGVYKLSENAKNNKDIFKNMILGYVLVFIGSIVMSLIMGAGMIGGLSSFNQNSLDLGVGIGMGGMIVGILVYVAFGIASIIKMYKALNCIGLEYNISLMQTSAKVYIAGILLIPFFGIGFLILLIFNIMKIFAYLKIEK
ncbi:DUF996 domain-containing protein [Arcobacter cloacae]|uniref:Uncharacterized protein n=1 Tax=Arcobacter cloacae TaxID=1054034 RepID=A0A6M8NQ24_9BACT|nr:DUF996 domain-containing protein [Arcobacter cloacae]QKF90712.1 DUF996 domain-containing membrane protein [Arcobacter cloacae]RXI41493.1 hypothetical protein CP963_06910 [Arcobacter cloacae]